MNKYIRSFDSLQAALDFMETNRMELSEGAFPEQLALADGESHIYLSKYDDLWIMGRVISNNEFCEREAQYQDFKDPYCVYEFSEIVNRMLFNRERGIVPVEAFSVVTPQGEPGNVHVAAMAPAGTEAMAEFLGAGCHVTTPLLQPHVFQVIRHINEMRARHGGE